ncbi:DUF3042 family protein [Apilactobacillus apinorum]|uniref:DUF3042 family protein n=1 Tax=Apilactobacillus apinorum TaxID=1218495 RepID=A0ABP9ZIV6_9LACO|nr:DUF3042 family protein [Apilactobacillus apinorum]KOY68865.1 putative extracellular protein [Apilactobacillus apinorum]CAI2670895.1 Putative extracellular protein [Apilactobacillus apinorum]
MKKFAKGFFVGALATSSAVAGALFSFKKKVVDPVEGHADKLEENRRRVVRKQRSAHLN